MLGPLVGLKPECKNDKKYEKKRGTGRNAVRAKKRGLLRGAKAKMAG